MLILLKSIIKMHNFEQEGSQSGSSNLINTESRNVMRQSVFQELTQMIQTSSLLLLLKILVLSTKITVCIAVLLITKKQPNKPLSLFIKIMISVDFAYVMIHLYEFAHFASENIHRIRKISVQLKCLLVM